MRTNGFQFLVSLTFGIGLCVAPSPPLHAGQLERALMPGAVIQGHQKYEADCELCHSSFDKEQQPQLCLDCHKDVATDINGKRGLLSNIVGLGNSESVFGAFSGALGKQ